MPRPPPPLDRAVALACSAATFRDRWIAVTCCEGRCQIPMKMLGAEDARSRRTLADVVIRLRCTRCGQRPKAVHLVEDPAKGEGPQGPGPGWQVLLIGEDG